MDISISDARVLRQYIGDDSSRRISVLLRSKDVLDVSPVPGGYTERLEWPVQASHVLYTIIRNASPAQTSMRGRFCDNTFV